jgi:nitrate/nitrite transport system substrate-binding protein
MSEPHHVRVGFIPLTDCAPVVMAAHWGYDRRHGIEIELVRAPSWAAIRDGLLTGALDAAHALYGLVYGVQLGLGGPQRDLAVLMTLNRNGQAITLSRRLLDLGIVEGQALAARIRSDPRRYSFAQTFPTGTHALWLYYWLASFGVHPFRDIDNLTVPPPQMVANLAVGNVDGYCVGEPWNALAISQGVGFTVATSQSIWPDHPEKVLTATDRFVSARPDDARALVMAVLEACRELDTPQGRLEAARILAGPDYVNVPVEIIAGRLTGEYEDGRGDRWQDPHFMRFHADGEVNFPWLSDGMWFLTQFKRWGLLPEHPDYLAVARRVNRTGLYREAAAALGIAQPEGDTRTSVLMDGRVWDGNDPVAYAAGFEIAAEV